MPRKTKRQQLLAKQDSAAPFLFDEESLPIREDLVQCIREERHLHTGARLLDNDAKALRLVELLTAGWGIKKIALEMSVSPHSVRAARAVLVQSGKMAPYKARVVSIFEDIVETGAGNYLRALENNTVAARDIPVGAGIFSDKRSLALGEPTAIGVSAHAQLDQGALSVQALNAFVDSLPAAKVIPPAPPIDSPSEHQPPNPLQLKP